MKTEAPKEPTPQAQNEPLKMEGAAGDGPSAFAAGTVNKEYSGGTIGGGAGGGVIGVNRMQQGLFTDRLQRHLQEELNRNRKLRETDYRVSLRLWLARNGTVQRAELAQSTGNVDVDALLQQALLQVAALREALPDNLQQPIRIRVTARGGR
jgi:protein TonB